MTPSLGSFLYMFALSVESVSLNPISMCSNMALSHSLMSCHQTRPALPLLLHHEEDVVSNVVTPPSLVSKLDKPHTLSRSSKVLPSSPFTILVSLLWTYSGIFICFLHCGPKNWTQYLRGGPTIQVR